MNTPTTTLVYLAYGDRKYLLEAWWSIITAWGKSADRSPPFAIRVYSSNPEFFSELPVDAITLSEDDLRSLRNGSSYNFIEKVELLRQVLIETSGPVMFVDTDTWFHKDPLTVTSRISPSTAILHKREFTLQENEWARREGSLKYSEKQWRKESGYSSRSDLLGPDTFMWNSGLIGVAPEHEPLLSLASALMGIIYEHTTWRIAEQLAVGAILSRHANIYEGHRDVEHYWDSWIYPDIQTSIRDYRRSQIEAIYSANRRGEVDLFVQGKTATPWPIWQLRLRRTPNRIMRKIKEALRGHSK